jgi:hypothetical protein
VPTPEIRISTLPSVSFRPRRQHQFRAEDLQKLPAFQAHGVRHSQDQPIPARCGHKGQRNPGIAAGGFNEDGILFDHASFFGVLN